MKILVVIYFFTIINFGNSQAITWQKLYNGQFYNSSDNGRGVCETTRENIFVTGFEISQLGIRGTVLKLKPNGDTLWVKYFDEFKGSFILSSSDEGCIVAGENASLTKLDSNGEDSWQTNGISGAITTDFERASNGDYVICGYISTVISSPAFVERINSNGNLKWQKIFYAGNIKVFNSISETKDSNLIVCGYKYDCELCNGYPLLLELNNSGDSLWEKRYNLFADFKKIYSVETGYLIGGTILDSPFVYSNAFILNTNLNGEIIFRKNIKYNNREDFKDMRIVNKNRYVIACDTDTLNRRSGGVYIVDSLGNILFRNIFYVTDYSLFFSICPTSTGDLIFSGTVDSYLPN